MQRVAPTLPPWRAPCKAARHGQRRMCHTPQQLQLGLVLWPGAVAWCCGLVLWRWCWGRPVLIRALWPRCAQVLRTLVW